MRERVIVEYDRSTGSLYDAEGMLIANWHNLKGLEGGAGPSVETLVKLKNAGFTTDEIIELNRKELL